jgi:hypothetical protein
MDFRKLSLTQPLAERGVSAFVISTFDTDYLMVKEKDFNKAIDALKAQGHQIKVKD